MEWDDSKSAYERLVHNDSPQYEAMTTLLRFEREQGAKVSDYVSRCDEYKAFAKRHKD